MNNIKPYITAIILFSITSAFCQPGNLVTEFGNNGIFKSNLQAYERFADIEYLDDGSVIACGVFSEYVSDGIIMRISAAGEILWQLIIDQSNYSDADHFESVVIVNNEIFVLGNYYNVQENRSEIKVTKISINGEVDKSFGEDGSIIITHSNNIQGWKIIADVEGNLLIPGIMYGLDIGIVIKLKPNGELDDTFGDNGFSQQPFLDKKSSFVNAEIVGQDLYAIGWFRSKKPEDALDGNGLIVKLSKSGERDENFATDGVFIVDVEEPTYIFDIKKYGANDLVFLSGLSETRDGTFLHKINFDGNKDLGFGENGIVEFDFGPKEYMDQLNIDDELGIYISGSINDSKDLTIAKLLPDGKFDSRFGNNGHAQFDIEGDTHVKETILGSDGTLVVAGYAYENFNSEFLVVKIEGVPACSNIIQNITLEGCNQVTHNGTTYTNTGQYNLTFTNTNGCDSTVTLNVVINKSSAETIIMESCGPITINAEVYSSSGTYIQSLTNSAGCDSLLTIQFQNKALEAIIEIEDQSLKSLNNDATIQWYDCNEGNTLEGESSLIFMPSKSGEYALILSNETCIDTSECVTVEITSSIIDLPLITKLKVYPNPAYNNFLIEKLESDKLTSINVFDTNGRSFQIQYVEFNHAINIDIREVPAGIYFMKIIFNSSEPYVARIAVSGER